MLVFGWLSPQELSSKNRSFVDAYPLVDLDLKSYDITPTVLYWSEQAQASPRLKRIRNINDNTWWRSAKVTLEKTKRDGEDVVVVT